MKISAQIEQSSGYLRRDGREGESEIGQSDQLYGDGWKLNFWW